MGDKMGNEKKRLCIWESELGEGTFFTPLKPDGHIVDSEKDWNLSP